MLKCAISILVGQNIADFEETDIKLLGVALFLDQLGQISLIYMIKQQICRLAKAQFKFFATIFFTLTIFATLCGHFK
jgi:hypothetical protein